MHAPARTVFTTNTSTLAPSALVRFVDRPEKFLALHFAIGVWDSNLGEVMGHAGTAFRRGHVDLRRCPARRRVPTLKSCPGHGAVGSAGDADDVAVAR